MDYNKVHNEIKETFNAKNHDYGNSFEKSLDKFGLIAAVVRINDKFERLTTLCDRQRLANAKVDESLADTLKDAANYCIMAAAWLEDKTKA
jgi:hypothetical protein